MEMNHLHTSGIEESGIGMTCHLCGATGDPGGKKFINPSRLLEHMRQAHPEAVTTPHFSPIPPIKPTQVYPLTRSAPLCDAVTPPAAEPPQPTAHAKFCPQCGFNMAAIEAAMKSSPPPRRGDA